MLGDQELDGLGPRSSRILVRVPLGRGHLGKERLHLGRVVEQLPVQVARVPVDEDAPEVEDHGGEARRVWHPARLSGEVGGPPAAMPEPDLGSLVWQEVDRFHPVPL